MPSSFTQAFNHHEWQLAMDDEYNALPPKCKWVYRVKRKPNGSIACYKACLVDKGFDQEEGVDYFEPLSPIVKKPTVELFYLLLLSLIGHFAN